MLFDLHIQVAYKLIGQSPASFFEHATGLSRMTYQRGRGYAALISSREKTGAPTDSLLLRMMQKHGTTDTEFPGFRADIPTGISSLMIYGMGLLDDGCAPATRELVKQFDASDLRLCRFPDTDVAGFLAEIGPESPLGPDYCAPLHVSGFRCPAMELPDAERAALQLVVMRRAHMALSFLAVVDHEMGRWNDCAIGGDAMVGRPRFGVLLARPEPGQRKRLQPLDPIARLVDFLGAAGYRVRTGDWPKKAPTIVEMGAGAELSGAVAGDGARFVKGLRSGEHPMTRSAFRVLVRSQFWTADAPTSVLDDAADQLEPYLVAAHLMTLLMPDHAEAKGHLDRTGWRDAYMGWWERHADRFPPPVPSSSIAPPDWLLNP